jgi:hypothetical protein
VVGYGLDILVFAGRIERIPQQFGETLHGEFLIL